MIERHPWHEDDPIGGPIWDDAEDDAFPSGLNSFVEHNCQGCGAITLRLDEWCTPCSDRLYREEKDAWGMA